MDGISGRTSHVACVCCGDHKTVDMIDYSGLMDVSVVIVNWNTRCLLDRCLRSIEVCVGRLSAQGLVVDNGSTRRGHKALRYPQHTLAGLMAEGVVCRH